MAAMSIKVLGAIRVFSEKDLELHLPGTRTRELLARLVVRAGAPIRREVLIEEIWPNIGNTRGRRALNTELWRLKTSLKQSSCNPVDWLESSSDSICLRLDRGVTVDLVNFRKGVNECKTDKSRLLSILSLYDGDFAEDLEADWANNFRQSIRSEYLNYLYSLVDHFLNKKDFDTALAIALRLCTEEPYDELAQRQMIGLHIKRGNRSTAARLYQSFERLLQKDLGVVPSPETAALMCVCQDGAHLKFSNELSP